MFTGIVEKAEKNRAYFLLLLFIITLFFRFPALLVDYYDVDELAAIVQTREYFTGAIPEVDFNESKKPLYHRIFKFSYELNREYGWVIVHFITILFVFMTSFFIYLTGNFLRGFKTGALSAVFYSVFISCFNKDFMATNAEVIYNLFFSAGFYFLIISLSAPILKKLLYSAVIILMAYAAFQVKFHGIMLIVTFITIYMLYLPYYRYGKRVIYAYAILFLAITVILTISYMSGSPTALSLFNSVMNRLAYAIASERKFTLLHFIGRLIYRHGLFFLWHMILWIPAAVYIFKFMKNGFKWEKIEESVLAVCFIVLYLMVYGGLARFYYHYFMPSYTILCIISSTVILNIDDFMPEFIRKRLLTLFLVPVIFFFTWNVKDALIKNFFPGAFYNEGPFLFWTRAVLTGRYNSYLLPSPEQREVIEYIKKNSDKDDRIFVWGNGPELYYYSRRGMGGFTMWPKNVLYEISLLYKKGNSDSIKEARKHESKLIYFFEKKRPVLFIDTSRNEGQKVTDIKLIRPAVFDIPLKSSRMIYKYVLKNYELKTTINEMKIYKRK